MFRMDRENPRSNASGYLDETAYAAIKKTDDEFKDGSERFYKLLNSIRDICELSDFQIIGRITIKDKRSGKVWR